MRPWSVDYQNKYVSLEDLPKLCEHLRSEGKTISTLNGSFDLLHAGHLHMIYEASQLADVLIMGLNSDQSIQQYKSPNRPIIPCQERMQMLAALEFVDYVTSFDETTPIHFLTNVQPNIHVNGSEYGENCIEAETVKRYGGYVHIVQKLPGLSTSCIIQKIRKS